MTEAREFPDSSISVAKARQFAREALDGVGDDVAEPVALLVSEIATNSVLHARTGFTVSVDTAPDQITVSVTDGGEGAPSMRAFAPEEISGRGLRIVESLADAWGVVPSDAGKGKTVWFVVNRPIGH